MTRAPADAIRPVAMFGGIGMERVFKAWKIGKRRKVGAYSTDGETLYIHGNCVLRGRPDDFEVHDHGWQSMMTKGTLNPILRDLTAGWHISAYSGFWALTGPAEEYEWPHGKWVRFRNGVPVAAGLRPGSEVHEKVREHKRVNREDARKRNRDKNFASLALERVLMNAIGGDVSASVAKVLTSEALQMRGTYGMEWVDGADSNPSAAARFLLQAKDMHRWDELVRRVRYTDPKIIGMDTDIVQEPLEGEGSSRARWTRRADVSDPSDTELQNDQLDVYETYPVDPDSVYNRGGKGRGKPYGSPSGDGELRTNLPAASSAAGARTAGGTPEFDDAFRSDAIRIMIRDILAGGHEEAELYRTDGGDGYTALLTSLGSNEESIARVVGVEMADEDWDMGSDLRDALDDMCSGMLESWGLPGQLGGEWYEGELYLAYFYDDDVLRTIGQITQERGPLEASMRTAAARLHYTISGTETIAEGSGTPEEIALAAAPWGILPQADADADVWSSDRELDGDPDTVPGLFVEHEDGGRLTHKEREAVSKALEAAQGGGKGAKASTAWDLVTRFRAAARPKVKKARDYYDEWIGSKEGSAAWKRAAQRDVDDALDDLTDEFTEWFDEKYGGEGALGSDRYSTLLLDIGELIDAGLN